VGNSGGVRAEREASELLAVVVVDGTVAGVVTQSVNPGLVFSTNQVELSITLSGTVHLGHSGVIVDYSPDLIHDQQGDIRGIAAHTQGSEDQHTGVHVEVWSCGSGDSQTGSEADRMCLV